MSKATLTKRLEFCSSHRYHNPKWDDEKNREIFGPCNNPNTHGHNYLLEVTLSGEIDSVTGMIINLYDLKQYLWEVLIEFDHKNLNMDTPYFDNRIPTTENLARTLWEVLSKHPQLPKLDHIRLYEDETLYADVTAASFSQTPSSSQELPCATMTRCYNFSSAIDSPAKHITGHNYLLEVTVAGPIASETGQVVNLQALDDLVQNNILSRFHEHNLSRDPAFQQSPPTEAYLAQTIYQELLGRLPQHSTLAQVTVHEKPDTATMVS